MIQIGVLGARGRMGKWVTQLLENEFPLKAKLAVSVDQLDKLESLLSATDVVIDFSSPNAVVKLLQIAVKTEGKLPALVVGSTGWKPDDLKRLEDFAKRTPVFMTANFSTGVMALVEALKAASPLLGKLGYVPVLTETHHCHKLDSPSGTAITLQKTLAPHDPMSIQTHSIRAGEVIGDHEVSFYGPGDHLVFGHFAQDRSIFARGAIEVALWLADTKNLPPPKAMSRIFGMDSYFESLKELKS